MTKITRMDCDISRKPLNTLGFIWYSKEKYDELFKGAHEISIDGSAFSEKEKINSQSITDGLTIFFAHCNLGSIKKIGGCHVGSEMSQDKIVKFINQIPGNKMDTSIYLIGKNMEKTKMEQIRSAIHDCSFIIEKEKLNLEKKTSAGITMRGNLYYTEE